MKENVSFAIRRDIIKGDASVVSDGHESLDGERGLYELGKQGLLGGDENSKLDFWENCVYGKASHVKFNATKHITQGILEYLHSDLWVLQRWHQKVGLITSCL